MNERKEKLLKQALWLSGTSLCIYLARIEDATGDALAILRGDYKTYQHVLLNSLGREVEVAIVTLRDAAQVFECLIAATERYELGDIVRRIRALRCPDMMDDIAVEALKAEAASIRTALEAVRWRGDE